MLMAFHIPRTRSPNYPAIEVLETLLATGESSRLYTRLVDGEQVALNIQAMEEPSLDPFLLSIAVQPRAGVALDKVRTLLEEELQKLEKSKVSEAELRKAKNQWLAAHYREMKTIAGRANLIGTYQIFYGDYKRLYEDPTVIEKVTVDDVQRAAQTLFPEKNRTVGALIPRSVKTQGEEQ